MQRDPNALTGKPLAVFVPIEERSNFRARLAMLGPSGSIDDWRLRLTAPGGEVRVTAHVLASDHADDDAAELDWMLVSEGDPVGSAVADDVTLSDIAGKLGHELNQPLAAIVSYARGAILRSRAGTLAPEDLEQVLSIIVAEAMRVADRLRRLATQDERST